MDEEESKARPVRRHATYASFLQPPSKYMKTNGSSDNLSSVDASPLTKLAMAGFANRNAVKKLENQASFIS